MYTVVVISPTAALTIGAAVLGVMLLGGVVVWYWPRLRRLWPWGRR